MQAAVQSLANYWNARDCAIGFGVGIAMGPATVGTLGWHGRLDYTAIGNVVNLASRLCDLAEDAQILVDPVVTAHVQNSTALASIGERAIKGYNRALEVFAVVRSAGPLPHLGCPLQPADVHPVETGFGRSAPELSPTDAG
jgi:class 3 adenylate cyclase